MSRENGGGGDMVEEEESGISGGEYKRHKVVGFVGIQTGFGWLLAGGRCGVLGFTLITTGFKSIAFFSVKCKYSLIHTLS